MITIVKETNYFHPDMHLHTNGHGQDDIMNDFVAEMSENGVTVEAIRKIGADGKEYITHISYTGAAEKVNEAVIEQDIIEAENASVA